MRLHKLKEEYMMEKVKGFLKRKDIEFSAKRYFQDALSAMALGLFSSLLIGLIIKTVGEQVEIWVAPCAFSEFCIETVSYTHLYSPRCDYRQIFLYRSRHRRCKRRNYRNR